MLNEPFGILDNIPLIWCFASFETYQSRLVEIVTQKRGLADTLRSAQFIHFHASYSHNTQSATRAREDGAKLCLVFAGEGRQNER